MIVWVLLVLSVLANVGMIYVIKKGAQRLLEFDNLIEMLSHDLNINIEYFDSIKNNPVLGNADEIVTADRNMRIMNTRFDEYIIRMEELTRRKLRKPKVIPNPPVVR